MPTLDLSIIILNFNTSDWLENALRSIRDFKPSCSHEVIVVDNASSDDSVEMVKKKFPQVVLIKSKENGGFAKGNNLGIKVARGRYIMLLNSDAEFTASTKIEQIVWLMDQNDTIGVTTPRLELPDGALDLASHRGEPTPWAALTYFAKLEKLFPNSRLFGQYHQTWKDINQIHEIEACSGAAMIVRSASLKRVGLLDENFFMYAEDLDWCRRFRQAGYKIYFFPESVVIHHKYKSGIGKTDAALSGLKSRSRTEKKDNSRRNEEAKRSRRVRNGAPKSNILTPTSKSAQFHFWQTMKQYYRKHYGKNLLTKVVIEWGVDVMRFFKTRR